MKCPIRRKMLHEDNDARLRVFIDLDARKVDASVVELVSMDVSIWDARNEGWTHEQLMAETMRTAAWLRTQFKNPYPPNVFIPFVQITLTDMDRVSASTRLQVTEIVGHVGEDDHTYAERTAHDTAKAMERVNVLGEAVDLLAFLTKPTGKRELQ